MEYVDKLCILDTTLLLVDFPTKKSPVIQPGLLKTHACMSRESKFLILKTRTRTKAV